jgi:hypothetical protein
MIWYSFRVMNSAGARPKLFTSKTQSNSLMNVIGGNMEWLLQVLVQSCSMSTYVEVEELVGRLRR